MYQTIRCHNPEDHNMNLSLLFVFDVEISLTVFSARRYAEKFIRVHLFFIHRVSVYKETTSEYLYIDANLPHQNVLPCFRLKFQSLCQDAWNARSPCYCMAVKPVDIFHRGITAHETCKCLHYFMGVINHVRLGLVKHRGRDFRKLARATQVAIIHCT
jgi:hypothetical protein